MSTHESKAVKIHEFCKERITDVITGYEYEYACWIDHGKDHEEATALAKVSTFNWLQLKARITGDDRAPKYRVNEHFELWKLGFPNHLAEVFGSDHGNDGI